MKSGNKRAINKKVSKNVSLQVNEDEELLSKPKSERIQEESMKIIHLHHQQHRHLQLFMIQVVIKIKFVIQRQNTNIIQINYVNLMNVVGWRVWNARSWYVRY